MLTAHVSPKTAASGAPETISLLSAQLASHIHGASKEIERINLQARILSLNAQIEAAQAGAAGAAFGVVAQEMAVLSKQTEEVSVRLRDDSQPIVAQIEDISRQLATQVRGTRLADLALMNIDLIDRNLYERSCDCRWWATDAALVAALETPSPAAIRHASERMGVILKAYTVYFDIVLADLDGRIIAHGNPALGHSTGTSCATAEWFVSALRTASGDEFGFESAHRSPLAGNERVLVYSCKVCRQGTASAEPMGVLGVIFRWDALADTIVRKTPVDDAERPKTRACIIDANAHLLADSAGRALTGRLEIPGLADLLRQPKGFAKVTLQGKEAYLGHAKSPGFETYATGWHSVVIQTV